MRPFAAAAVVLAAVAVLPAAARAGSDSSIRCAGGIVSVGDATIDLLGKCGEPALREGKADLTTVSYGEHRGATRRTTAVAVERWTYDFGPRAFVMIVTVDGGKVSAIDRGSYGYVSSEPVAVPLRRARCEPSALHVGDVKLDVLSRCGEPTVAERREDLVRQSADLSAGVVVTRTTTIVCEVWTYDFGPQTFVRFVSFEDGVVTRIDTGNHGYAR